MFRSVRIIGYRGFTRYEMHALGRVNLLVGRNNSGKTSVLEALYLLGRQGDPRAFTRVCSQRGEFFSRDEARSASRAELDVAHLFNGHELSKGLEFSVGAENAGAEQTLTVLVLEVANIDAEDLSEVGSAEDLLAMPRHFEMQVLSSPVGRKRVFALTSRGGLVTDSGAIPIRSSVFNRSKPADNVHFVSTEAMGGGELSRLWDRIQLTPHEGLVMQALRFVDPGIEQIRATEIGAGPGTRGGFIVRRAGEEMPIPLGSLGDGAWRMLAIAIVLTQCAGGMLFIDEIDTGLHHTVMADMWRLIQSMANALDIQVFATTHSEDCVYSLASICRDDENAGDVTIQRIEGGRAKSVAYSEAEIRAAAEHRIEVR